MPASAKIGRNVKFGKGALGVVIHEKTVIGDDVIISHNVTFGGSSKKTKGKLPVIGCRVRIGAGAVILGDVSIGSDVIIGANSVVSVNVADRTIVAGNPIRVLKHDINILDYVDF